MDTLPELPTPPVYAPLWPAVGVVDPYTPPPPRDPAEPLAGIRPKTDPALIGYDPDGKDSPAMPLFTGPRNGPDPTPIADTVNRCPGPADRWYVESWHNFGSVYKVQFTQEPGHKPLTDLIAAILDDPNDVIHLSITRLAPEVPLPGQVPTGGLAAAVAGTRQAAAAEADLATWHAERDAYETTMAATEAAELDGELDGELDNDPAELDAAADHAYRVGYREAILATKPGQGFLMAPGCAEVRAAAGGVERCQDPRCTRCFGPEALPIPDYLREWADRWAEGKPPMPIPAGPVRPRGSGWAGGPQ